MNQLSLNFTEPTPREQALKVYSSYSKEALVKEIEAFQKCLAHRNIHRIDWMIPVYKMGIEVCKELLSNPLVKLR